MTLAQTHCAVRVCSIPDPASPGAGIRLPHSRPAADDCAPASEDRSDQMTSLQASLTAESDARLRAEALLAEKERSLQASNRALEKVARNLDEQRLQLNTILDHTAAGIFLANPAQEIISVNNAGRVMFGIADDDAIFGMSMSDLFSDSESCRDILKQAQMGCCEDDLEAEARRIDGSEFPVEFAVNTVATDGDKKQSVWIIRDISARREVEGRNAALRQELATAQKLEALGTLASGVAHEINTPVQYIGDNLRFVAGAVNGMCELIGAFQHRAPPEVIEQLQARINIDFLMRELPKSISQSQHGLSEVARIVGAIREYSHPGGGPTTMVPVNDAVTNAMALSRNVWKNVAEISFTADPGNPAVEANTGDLSQVLVNMIVNSAFAVEKRQLGRKGQIRIATRALRNTIEIEIDDNGGGIDEDTIEKIFDPFFTTKDVGEGSGQGLAISRNIIHNKHRGRIVCSNRPGDGVSFTIVLPVSGEQSPARAI